MGKKGYACKADCNRRDSCDTMRFMAIWPVVTFAIDYYATEVDSSATIASIRQRPGTAPLYAEFSIFIGYG